MKRILITGGAGFIGSHTTLLLLKQGYLIEILDSFVNSSKDAIEGLKNILKLEYPNSIKNLNVHEGDVRDQSLLIKVFEKYNDTNKPIEAVIHFAGLKSIKESIKNPRLYWDNNVKGTETLLKVMQMFDCSSIIFSSTASLYGSVNSKKIREDFKIRPNNQYSKTKAKIEEILFNLHSDFPNKWRIANLRYFNPIGAHPSGKLGENPKGSIDNIFPIINRVAGKLQNKLQIYGKDWGTKDGTCIRDFIHVLDLAEGHIAALKYLFKNKSQIIVFNLGTGSGTSVLELVKTFERCNNIKISSTFVDRREGDIESCVADISKAKEILKWEPSRDLIQMCQDGWKWQLKNMKRIY